MTNLMLQSVAHMIVSYDTVRQFLTSRAARLRLSNAGCTVKICPTLVLPAALLELKRLQGKMGN